MAILQGNFVKDSVVFTATAGVGPASRLTLVSGNLQTGRVASALGQQLVVNVKDQFGFAVSGKQVTWAAGSLSGAVTPVADTTDAQGNANAVWVLGTTAIAQSATATVAGIVTPVGFTATATADTSRRVRIHPDLSTTKTLPSAAAGGSAGTLTVLVTDQYGNVVRDTVNFAVQITGGGAVTDTLVESNAAGQASTSWTLGPRVGVQTLRARLATRPTSTPVVWSDTATVLFTDIAVGNFHVCGLTSTSRVFCWGLNDVGQLGKGSFNPTTMPSTAVAQTADSSANANTLRARQVSGSRSSICVVTLANQVFCWGKGWGSLGTSNLPLAANVQAAGGGGTVLGIVDYQVAEDHACLIQTSGVSNCTGNNDHGQLGDKSAGPPFTSPGTGTWPWVDGQKTFSIIRLGTSFSCGFHRYLSEAAGAVPDSSQIPLCWGNGTEGQRGDNATSNTIAAPNNSSVPFHIKVNTLPVGIAFDSLTLALGDKHACAAAVTSGIAYCWGLNAHGQLGRATIGVGNAARDSVAGAVAGSPAFVRLYAGKFHTCGLTSDGTAHCWGRNDSGQLGIGSVTTFNTGTNAVTAVSTSLKFRSLSLGELSTCGVTGTPGVAANASSRVYCWGDNSFGQLGTGNTTSVLSPAKVNGQP
ncbi:MAG: hypothetical protein FJ363_07765 [Gemmatimonadetes bacterium]|nr:hypothetical protein [Gemmatimonadota bacterium]